MEPKVSIILPNYNGGKYLKETIQSVLNQTFENFEFIIVDDASTDNSRQVIEEFQDNRIITYYSDVNRHVAYATNIGFEMAKGEYIARIDSDDQWEKEKLEKQLSFLESNLEYAVCFTRVNIIDEYSQFANDKYKDIEQLFNSVDNKSQKDWIRYFFYEGNCLCNPSALMRKTALDTIGRKYNIAYVPAQDFEMWTRMIQKYPIYVMDEKLVRYRWTDEESKISGTKSGKEYAFRNVHMLVRKKMVERMSDDVWNKFFGEESNDRRNIEFEKAQLLLHGVGKDTNFLGLDKFEDILNDSKQLQYLEKKGFSLKEYYKEYRVRNFGLPWEISEKDNKIIELNNRNQENQERINQLNEEIDRMRREIKNMRESTSWKITRPLRKAGRVIRKEK